MPAAVKFRYLQGICFQSLLCKKQPASIKEKNTCHLIVRGRSRHLRQQAPHSLEVAGEFRCGEHPLHGIAAPDKGAIISSLRWGIGLKVHVESLLRKLAQGLFKGGNGYPLPPKGKALAIGRIAIACIKALQLLQRVVAYPPAPSVIRSMVSS